ncbi:MAG TPA: IucA/IucC family siderophore biosynthesis protein [Actinospica sp.]|nr:IucA/IucC family siderophore biosynthesis protein [Actinospica sp.]
MGEPGAAVAHLAPEHWERANRHVVRKALAEFAHERLINPQVVGDGRYVVVSDDGGIEYVFRADVLALDHWRIDAGSIVRRRVATGEEMGVDALDLILDLRHGLSLTPTVLPVYLEEIGSTLASAAYKLAGEHVTAAELAVAGFQDVEAGMTEGHPCFVANNGRLGFDAVEYLRYAPEAGRAVRLVWVAARRESATFTAGAGLEYSRFVEDELGAVTLERFRATVAGLGLSLDDYLLIPVHPWQWTNKLAVTYAGELARRDLVCLGYGDDAYRAQQSIRTFFNGSAPGKCYVKTALSVLNMGFMRGLSAAYMEATPAINDWLYQLVAGDPVLRACGFGILRERAAVGYRHRQYGVAGGKGSPYLKMLAALWRESPVPRLGPGERVMTMAALLHVDRDGNSLASALIAESGRGAREWVRAYLDAYLVPVLHCFYAYGLVYMPHGENVILVLDEAHTVRRVLFKDIAEEIAVLDPRTPLPEGVARIRADVPDELRVLSIFTDVFDCFLRFLGAILEEECDLWPVVAQCVADYQQTHPEFADRFAASDLFAERFPLSCLNRLQLRDNRQMVDLADPASALQLAGTLENPIAKYRLRGV